jgi:ubiquitin thioesterase protein OTUB1
MQLKYNKSKNCYLEPAFQVTTNMFKNSVWNWAHFRNPDFHLKEWDLEVDNINGWIGSGRKA